MILKLNGHEYKYAAEQIMLMQFPGEKPEYAEPVPGVLSAEISLKKGNVYSVVTAQLTSADGKKTRGEARVKNDKLTDKIMTDRLLQRCVKLAFYKAATELTGNIPVWGALTGIRPGKFVTNMLLEGHTEQYAVNAMMRENFVSHERAMLCLDTAKAGIAAKNALKSRDICLYVGIPFCPTRCAYCSFVSNSVEKTMKLVSPFLTELEKEIEHDAAMVKELGLRIVSVYMGGGTPTTLSAPQLERLLTKTEQEFDLTNVCEYTVEAGRPDTITPEKLKVLKTHGITRISVNPQTMQDSVLNVIGRKHTAQDIADAIEMSRRAEIPAINMDLIAGLPSDTYEGFCASLDRTLEFGAENITIHTLSLKKGTKITLEGTTIPDGDTVGKMLDYAENKLRREGYVPYYLYRQKYMSGGFENVGWCKPGYDSFYNICIMEELCSILSLGGGGSTKLVSPEKGRIERIFNPKYPQEYISGLDKIFEKKQYIWEFYTEEDL